MVAVVAALFLFHGRKAIVHGVAVPECSEGRQSSVRVISSLKAVAQILLLVRFSIGGLLSAFVFFFLQNL